MNAISAVCCKELNDRGVERWKFYIKLQDKPLLKKQVEGKTLPKVVVWEYLQGRAEEEEGALGGENNSNIWGWRSEDSDRESRKWVSQ